MSTSDLTQARTPRQIPRAQAGMSMIELVVFIVIIGIATAGVLTVMIQGDRAAADPQMRKQAVAIAEGLLEEIALSHFTYCDPADPGADTASSTGACTVVEKAGPEAGNTRPHDNVNDYVAAFGVEQQLTPINDINSAAVGDLNSFTAFLMIVPESLGVGAGVIAADATDPSKMEVLRIRVRVHYASEDVVLDGYRTRYAPNFLP